jgi:N-acetylglucosaminyldiphosphoundecaprenol N-acetyl-beta-D-mannosaminyltransferase
LEELMVEQAESIKSDQQLSLAGIRVDALTQRDLLELMRPALGGNTRLVLYHNLHSLYLFETDEAFRRFYQRASSVYIDGLPLIWLGRALGLPLRSSHRVTFLDCFDAVLQRACANGCRIFYLGSNREVVAEALPLLRAKHPGLLIAGHHGYLATEAESDSVISEINEFRTDVLFVGMGMPVQEAWLDLHMDELKAHVIFASGATLDYVTGHAYQPPRWAGNLGLYGLARMISDPKRLWRRYLLEPFLLAGCLLKRILTGSGHYQAGVGNRIDHSDQEAM